MDRTKLARYLRLLLCELISLWLVVAVLVVWILGWIGCLGDLSGKLKVIQSYTGLVNSVYGVLNGIILIIIGFKSKQKITMQASREREYSSLVRQNVNAIRDNVEENGERLSLLHNQVGELYTAHATANDHVITKISSTNGMVKNLQAEHRTLFDNMSKIIAQNKELLLGNKKILEVLDSPVAPVHITKDVIIRTEPELIKMCVVGDIMTGKTCLIHYWTTNRFKDHYRATIGVDFALKKVSTDIGEMNVQVWDIAGQERFGNMMKIYMKDALCLIILIDITREGTLGGAMNWLKMCQKFNPRIFPVFLLNKIDMIKNAQLNRETIDEALNGAPCFWVSAKTGENVDHAITLAALGAVVRASGNSNSRC